MTKHLLDSPKGGKNNEERAGVWQKKGIETVGNKKVKQDAKLRKEALLNSRKPRPHSGDWIERAMIPETCYSGFSCTLALVKSQRGSAKSRSLFGSHENP